MDIDTAWAALAAAPRARIADLFAAEPERLDRFTLGVEGLWFDWSKQAIPAAALDALMRLADAADLAGWRDKLFAGSVVNPSEARAATHPALRADGPDAELARLVERVAAGELGPVRHILHIGIGGSALGPALALDAIRDAHRYETAVVSNIDGSALAAVFERFDPVRTLVVVVSKTFTTLETLLNARTALAWMRDAGVADPAARAIAVTAAPDKARAWGARHLLAFDDTVGGRYSLWSAVGVSVALAWGIERWAAFLAGARAFDEHFRTAAPERNAAILAALVDVWNASVLDHPTRAVFPYDERLRLLPAYLQQLEMESNGKRVDRAGATLTRPSAPVTWGATGTDAQHAVFQWLHQATATAPAEFLAVREPGHGLDPEHHRHLLGNCLAQGAALMRGRDFDAALTAAGGDAALAAARTFPGDRASTTVLVDRLDARTLGMLLAWYEHRTFAAGVLWGVNPFDQWGVELGKAMAASFDSSGTETFDPSTRKLAEMARLFSNAYDQST